MCGTDTVWLTSARLGVPVRCRQPLGSTTSVGLVFIIQHSFNLPGVGEEEKRLLLLLIENSAMKATNGVTVTAAADRCEAFVGNHLNATGNVKFEARG